MLRPLEKLVRGIVNRLRSYFVRVARFAALSAVTAVVLVVLDAVLLGDKSREQ
jgi:hypothetical protein